VRTPADCTPRAEWCVRDTAGCAVMGGCACPQADQPPALLMCSLCNAQANVTPSNKAWEVQPYWTYAQYAVCNLGGLFCRPCDGRRVLQAVMRADESARVRHILAGTPAGAVRVIGSFSLGCRPASFVVFEIPRVDKSWCGPGLVRTARACYDAGRLGQLWAGWTDRTQESLAVRHICDSAHWTRGAGGWRPKHTKCWPDWVVARAVQDPVPEHGLGQVYVRPPPARHGAVWIEHAAWHADLSRM